MRNFIQTPGYLSPRSATFSLDVTGSVSAPESIDSDRTRLLFPQDTCPMLRGNASMSGEGQDGPAGMAVQDASEDLNRAHLARPRSKLKIIFVNSSPYRRSARVRRNTTHTIHQTESLSFTPGHGPLAGDPDSSANCFPCEASEDESDQDYDDDDARSTKRPRARRSERHTRKQKRHGRLAAADRDLIFAAQQGELAHKPPKKAPRIAEADAVNLIATIVERVDWRGAVAVQQKLQAMSNESVAKSDMLKMDGDAAVAKSQLKQYWSNVLVSSVLGMKTK